MPRVTVNNISIHYQTMGQGPDVVMIHGIASSLGFWYFGVVPILIRAGASFRVTIYDLRGHGYSDMPELGYTSADMADDLAALLDSLGIEKPHFVGHSFGGLVALHYAVLHPENVAKLVVADTGIPAVQSSRKSKPIWEVWGSVLKRFGVSIDEDKADDIDYLIQQTQKLREERGRTSRAEAGLLLRLERLADLAKKTSLMEDFRAIAGLTIEKIGKLTHPILASYGERSPSMASYRYLSENLPNCRSIIIPGAGHFHPLERSDEFVHHVREHLEG